jgi:hypothetical protein
MVVRERRSRNLRGTGLEPKVAQRPGAATVVGPGNHILESPVLEAAPDIGAVEVLHFPMRTFEQFERKVIKTGVGYECLPDRPPETGVDQLELLSLHRQGRLGVYYDAEQPDPERIACGLAAGDLVEDRRLQTFFASAAPPAPSSIAAQRLMRRAWATRAAGDKARGELARTNAALAGATRDLEALRASEAELRATLTAIRASRIMRYTAGLRGLYYRKRSR